VRRLSPQDRPREKLARVGAGALGDNELLALVIGQGSRPQNALELATQVLEDVGGLFGLSRATCDALQRARGVGSTKAGRIVAAVELGRRTLLDWTIDDRPQLASPREAAAYLVPRFGSRSVEQFGVMLLDTRSRLIRTSLLSIGVLDGTYTHPREVFREAVTGGAATIVLFHNHPSGDPTPSRDDVLLTKRMFEAGELLGIAVVDHLVLADNRYYSFRESRSLEAGWPERLAERLGVDRGACDPSNAGHAGHGANAAGRRDRRGARTRPARGR
jgi:DNA repair protein RadC